MIVSRDVRIMEPNRLTIVLILMSGNPWSNVKLPHFNLSVERIQTGEHCNAVYQWPDGTYKVKTSSTFSMPYTHGAYPDENSWIFYWYTGDEDLEIEINFEK